MKNSIKIMIFFSILNINLNAGLTELLNDSKKINKNESKMNVEEQKEINNIDIAQIQKIIDENLSHNNVTKVINVLNVIGERNDVSVAAKQQVYNYAFITYLMPFLDKKLNFDEKETIKQNLSSLISKIDKDQSEESYLNTFLYKIIMQDKFVKKYIDGFIKKYYPITLDNKDIFFKLFKTVNSDFVPLKDKKNYTSYNSKFKKYLNTSTEYSEDLLLEKLKFADYTNSNGELKKYSKKVIFNNKFSSEGYYYLAKYYLNIKNYKKFEENIKKSIQYNANNSLSFYTYIHYLVDKKIKLKSAIKLSKYYLTEINDENWNDKIKYELSLAYLKNGIEERNFDDAKKALSMFREQENDEFIQKSKNALQVINYKRYKKEIK